jgi:hypothetical protein
MQHAGTGERLPSRQHIWAERELFKVILEKFGLLPITLTAMWANISNGRIRWLITKAS